MPTANAQAWEGEAAFLAELTAVEMLADLAGADVGYQSFRGLSPCRLCGWGGNGFREFHVPVDSVNGGVLRWPEGLKHYYRNHHVLPSKPFFRIVMSGQALAAARIVSSRRARWAEPKPLTEVQAMAAALEGMRK